MRMTLVHSSAEAVSSVNPGVISSKQRFPSRIKLTAQRKCNVVKLLFFLRLLEFLPNLDLRVDILHINTWLCC